MEQLARLEKNSHFCLHSVGRLSTALMSCRSPHIKLTGAFLVNWHLVSPAPAAATEFFGHQGQLMETSYAQLIWYQIALSTTRWIKIQNTALQIIFRWEVGAQRQFSCSWLGAMSLFNRRSGPARQLQLGLLSRTIFSAQPINGALKHTAQNTIPGVGDCGRHVAVLRKGLA